MTARRPAAQARQSMITALLLHGKQVDEIAKAAGLDPAEVQAELDELVAIAREEVIKIPEGSLFLAEAIGRAYADFTQEMMEECREQLRELKADRGNERRHQYMQGAIRISLELLNGFSDRLERLGFVEDSRIRLKANLMPRLPGGGTGVKIPGINMRATEVGAQHSEAISGMSDDEAAAHRGSVVAGASGRRP